MTTTNTVIINEIPVDATDPTKTAWGPALSAQYFFVLVNGTGASEEFDAADISAATRTRMAEYGRGISVVMGGGDDTITGSAYGDVFNAGAGVNRIDGGANGGTAPDGSKARDVLNVFAASSAAAEALQVTALEAGATGADGEAYAAGYRIKVSNGDETDYLKDIEQINVFRADQGNAYVRTIMLAVDVREIAPGPGVEDAMHFAWAQGTDRADSFDAQADVSAATRDLMADHGRGVYVDMGAGNDTVLGSGYGDDITLGSGTNYADGGPNAGSTPWGGKPQDVLHVVVADAAAAAAVQVLQLAAGMSGLDADAFARGYTHKVVAGGEIDYIKGIERVSVELAGANGGSSFVRDIALDIVVHEADLSDPNLGDYMHLAWVNGTAGNDSIDAGGDLLSAGVKAKMNEGQQGVWIDGGSGNDSITGSAYGDNIRNGSGNAHIDGGANEGGMDVFEIAVDSLAAMNAVQVAASDDPAYSFMVTYGSGGQKDYLKNVEAIVVSVTGTGAGKWIPLAVQLHEIALGGDPAASMHHAWAQGTDRADSFDAASVSSATRALMTQHGRGIYADMGAGNDTVLGSGYGDDITLGSGTNYADGGLNAGSTPWGGKPQDVLHVVVANAAAAAAVQVVQLAPGLNGLDAEAFANGYTHKVVAGSEIDYIKGIERVSVEVAGVNGGSTFVRDIALEVVVHEANLADPALASTMHLAWVNGTAGNDTIDANELLSTGVKAKMDELHKGAWIDGGSGNDSIIGSAYGDNIRNGSGNAKIDGGANAGGMDVFEIAVDSTAAMNAVQVSASDDPAYSFMVTYGSGQTDYLKNVEAIVVSVAGTGAGKWIPLAVQVQEIAADADHADHLHFAWAQGTERADSFDAASVSSATRELMAEHGRGVYADMGAGNDTVVGSGYGDNIALGSGTNYADGGLNAGAAPWGARGADVLQVTVASQAAADAVQVLALASGLDGADADAFTAGYTHKVVAGNEIDYIKGFERVTILVANANGGSSWVRDVALAVQVHEAALDDPNIGNYAHLAWISGTTGADAIDAGAGGGLLSDAIAQQMAARGKGVHIDGGAGNDSITGSAYADHIRNGAGNAKIDGGANAGGKDVFEVVVASSAALNAVRVEVSDDPAHAFMVTYGDGQKDYLKNVEAVSVRVEGSSAGKWIPLAVEVFEYSGQNPASEAHLASVQGTLGNDSFDAASGLSDTAKSLMTQHRSGVYVDLGAGDDTIAASGWADTLVGGSGVNHIDGGAHASRFQDVDVLQMFVASQAQADAVAVSVLNAASTGADLAAFNAGYRFKVANGTLETNYLKNVERVDVMIWNDKDGDGQRDGGGASDPANEISFVRSIALAANSAPSFAGVPAGVAVDGIGIHSLQTGGTVLADGKLLSVRSLRLADGSSDIYLARHNADGSIDAGFGSGSGRVALPTEGVVANPSPVQLPDGKILVAVSTPGSNFDFKVMRLNADGTLDTTYGSNGAALIDFGTGSELPLELLLQPDGKLVVAGAGSVGVQPTSVVAARLNPDGSLDTGFGAGGKLLFAVPNASSSMSTLGLQADGKLLVGGFIVNADGNPDAALLRYNTDGSLDASFGDGGVFMLAIGVGTDNVRSVAMLPDGKILVAGTFRPTANDVDGFLLRLNADGSIDTGFGSGGIVKSHFTESTDVFGYIAVQPDGKIVAYGSMGQSTTASGGELVVVRYLANGQPDTDFGTHGKVSVPGHGIGIGMDPSGLALVDGKIVIFGSTVTDPATQSIQPLIARLNADGTLDASFNPAPLSSVSGSVRGDGLRPIALDGNAALYDAELHARGNYAGASLTLARQGGAAADDLFSALGDVSFASGQLTVGGTVIGTVTNVGGQLKLIFNSVATQGLVNRAMHGIGYSNGSATPPDAVSIDWTFSDGNAGAQGFGGALAATATSHVLIGTTVREVNRSLSNPGLSTEGQQLTSLAFLATVSGSARGESFDSTTQLSAQVKALMAELGRGARFDLGAGDDLLVATGGSDEIYAGSGTNRIDGGGHAGSYPFGGGPGRDTLHVLVADQAAANAVSITMLAAGMSGPDAEAFAAGYEVKVVNGSEIDYVKNVEMIKIFRWADANGNKTAEGNELVWMREIPVALRVYETAASSTDPSKATDGRPLKDIWHLASAEGWQRNDSFDALTDVSGAAQGLMAQQGRGVWVDGGGGDDTLAGSAYGDNFVGGAGTNYIDGRANGGSTPTGQRPEDVLEIYVDSQARANAVQALVLDAGATGRDAEAFAAGYTWKVTDGDAVNYVKNVEAVNIFIWTDANGDHDRDGGESPHARHIRLAASVNEVSRHATDPTKDAGGNPLSGYAHLAWVNGSAGDDRFDAATDVSAATLALMEQQQRGVFVETHGGNDTAVGTAYGDNFVTGAGINRIDGGAQRGNNLHGGGAFDVLEIYVASQAAADAVAVTALNAGMTGADGAAWADGYRFKVVNGTVSTDYLKDIELLNVLVWNDKDGDGERDWGTGDADPAREVSGARSIGLTANTAPGFAGAQGGAIVRDGSGDYGYVGGVVLPDGKLLALAYVADANRAYHLALERSNGDGSLDAGYGNGGRVMLDIGYGRAIPPLLLDSGKVVVTRGTFPGNLVELVRVNQDGSIDTGFGTDGASILDFGSNVATPYQVLESGGKLWVVGFASTTLQAVVARLNADGTLDAGFSGDGMLTLPVGSGSREVARGAAVQPDGKLVIVGYAQGSFNQDVFALRINQDGSYDTSFGDGGKVLLQAGAGVDAIDTATSMTLLPDGKIVIGGYVSSGAGTPTTYDGMLMRLNPDGSLDAGFGTGGVARVPGTPVNDYVFRVVALDDGSVLTLGITNAVNAVYGELTIARFRPDGSLDAAFGDAGMVRYTGRGMGADQGSLVVQDGKILVFGAVSNDLQGTASALLLRLNADGSLDTGFSAPGASSLGGTVRVDGLHFMALDTNAALFDAELAARGNYGGATLTLNRQGGVHADDLFGGVGEVSFANGRLVVGGIDVGSVSNSGGKLVLSFNGAATQELVNRAMHGIGYANANPAASGVTIGWSFSDGNEGSQGVGGAMSATGSTGVEIGLVKTEVATVPGNPNFAIPGTPMAQVQWMATVNGSAGTETFDAATGISEAGRGLVATWQRGVSFDMGGGGDTVTGTGQGDEFVMGQGINRVDGGDGSDTLRIVVADQAAADAVALSMLEAGMTGADGDAYAQGYRFKVTSGAETDYVRNVERIEVVIWQDKNGDRVRDDVSGGADEVTLARVLSMATNTAPTFSGAPAGVIVRDEPDDAGYLTGTVLRDGRLLMVNHMLPENGGYVVMLERSNADGSRDTSFGNGGKSILNSDYAGATPAPVELADGRVLLAHQLSQNTIRVTRMGTDGSVDTTFGSGGGTIISVPDATSMQARRTLLGPDGKLTLVGYFTENGTSDMLVARLNADGSMDAGFGTGGMLRLAVPGTSETARGAALQADGKLLITGTVQGSTNLDIALLRINANGTVDTTFGSEGKVVLQAAPGADGVDVVTDMQLLANGKVLLAGYTTAPASGSGPLASQDALLMRLNADGSLDTSFGSGGIARGPAAGTRDLIFEMALQDDGSVVMLGTSGMLTSQLDAALYLVRFRPDGSLDTGFGNGGEVRMDFRGNGGSVTGLSIVDGKIVVFGMTHFSQWREASAFTARFNADGSLDQTFTQAGLSSLGNTVRTDGIEPIAIDRNASIFDAELAAANNYAGATLTLQRRGGPAAEDIFLGTDEVSLANGRVVVAGVDVGSASNGNGVLQIVFNGSATQGLVNRAMHGIAYVNEGATPPSSVTLDWTFSDGNGGGQGLGGARSATGSSTVEIAVLKWEQATLADDPTKTDYWRPMSEVQWMAALDGTVRGETFSAATDLSPAVRGLMDTWQRGVHIDMGGGGDTVTGSAYSDEFSMGRGVNYVDGGANAGSHPYGGAGKDELHIRVANQSAADAVRLVKLEAGMTGADGAAFAAGYEAKVLNGAETDYIKHVERVVISIWNDADGDRVRDGGETSYVRDVPLQLRVHEIGLGSTPGTSADGRPLAESGHFAWIESWARDDSVNVATDVSSSTRALMAQYERGVYIDTGAGNDTIVGSGFGDNLVGGAGTNRIDGGANAGTWHSGGKAEDILDVYVTSQQAANAVAVTALAAGMGGEDGAAYADGYRWKVVAGPETDYVKNVEAVNISLWNDANGDGHRDNGAETSFVRQVALQARIDEIGVSQSDPTQDNNGEPLADRWHFAWVRGTAGDDVLDAAGISQPTRALMEQYGRGVWGPLGAGNDRMLGSDFGDNIDMGSGVNRFDGGANRGTGVDGNPMVDVLEVHVGTQAEADAVSVTALTGGMTGEDGSAFAEGYRFKVAAAGGQLTYIRNVEQVYVGIWQDTNGDGVIDHGSEVTSGRMLEVEQYAVPLVGEVARNAGDPTRSTDGRALSGIDFFASVTGTGRGDNLDAGDLSPQVLALMGEFGRGATYQMLGGDDSVSGTGYSDEFIMGGGINRVDGGDHAGTSPYGGDGRDAVLVYVPDDAAANMVSVEALTPQSGSEDAFAFSQGYEAKIVNGAETTYIRNVELVAVHKWTDTNGNGIVDGVEGEFLFDLDFRAHVGTIAVDPLNTALDSNGRPLAENWHFSWTNGRSQDDHVVIMDRLDSATLALMQQYGRGAWMNMGDGDDFIVGTPYGDGLMGGHGTNWIDGGEDEGTYPDGNPASDSVDIYATSLAARDAISFQALSGSATGLDLEAFNLGYQFKIVAGEETDYVKNVEFLGVHVWTDTNGNGQIDYETEISDIRHFALDPNQQGVIVVGEAPQN